MAAGSEQAARAGATMDEIVESVRKVTDIMAEISTASAEQFGGLQQINQAITQMDGATQQNAALVQDLGHTVRALGDEARNLRLSIDVLNTGGKKPAQAFADAAYDAAPALETQERKARGGAIRLIPAEREAVSA